MTEADVEESADALITQYRARAVYVAIQRLNESIDRGDLRNRDFWAQVVRAIHATKASRAFSRRRATRKPAQPILRRELSVLVARTESRGDAAG